MRSGHFPFWNPYVACGHPLFAALQSVVLYPLSAVYYMCGFDTAFNLFIILHVFLGGLFFYILMKDLKFTEAAAMISAVVFSFSGYIISVINLTTTLAAAIWFPLVFLFYRRILEADNLSSKFTCLVFSSVFLGLMFLGGEPTPMYATIFSLLLYSLMRVILKPRELGGIAIIFVSFIAIFILLFSFQILPFAELIRLSNRNQSLFDNSVYWSFPPRDMINLIMPFFYGPLHFQKDTPMRQDWLLLVYTGVIPLMLFLISLIFSKGREARFFKIIFACGLVFIFGRFTPIYKILYKFIPGFSFVRYPVKFFFLSAVSFSYLTGCAWQEYVKRVKDKDEKVRWTAATALGKLRDPGATEPLVAALKDENYIVRESAARSLGMIKDSRAVDPLISALKDSRPSVRVNISFALGEVQTAQCEEVLLQGLRNRDLAIVAGAYKYFLQKGIPVLDLFSITRLWQPALRARPLSGLPLFYEYCHL